MRGLERAVPRPAEVVVVFMDQPDGQVPETDLPVVVGHVNPPDGGGRLPLAEARNAAAELATRAVLVFLDVDCIPAQDAVGRLCRTVQEHPGSLVMGTPRYLEPDWLARGGASVGGAGSGASGPGADPDPLLRELSVLHAARAHLAEGPTQDWHLVWTLVLAVSAADHARLGGFDTGFSGYGAEDTDYSFRARDAGLALRHCGAEVFHQHHGVYRPPLHHVQDIVVNARRFRQVHGVWPMEGWLEQFEDLGLVRWDREGEVLEFLRAPTEAELTAARDDRRAY
ncbi:glycosyltransferase family 2 protein [Micrococcus terreus]|uniref:glycosyltransferase family 2 protein n=1 Tax=Micrococcus terreus TaxID=574650 RepID=UPI001FE63A8A|nr:glycosyltransferase [Micrococcus terreus]